MEGQKCDFERGSYCSPLQCLANMEAGIAATTDENVRAVLTVGQNCAKTKVESLAVYKEATGQE